MKMLLDCPTCKEKVDFAGQMSEVFDEDGTADFDESLGLWVHTIECNTCLSHWNVSISKVHTKKEEAI